MRIVIDMQGAQSDSRYRGIGRYSLSFVRALIQEGTEHEFFLVLNGDLPQSVMSIRQEFKALLPQSHIVLWHQPNPKSERESHNRWLRRSSELIREALILNLDPDIVHITSFFEGYVDHSVMSISWLQEKGIPISVSLYDLIPLSNPKLYLDTDLKYKAYYFGQLAQFKKANLFLGISQFTCQEAINYLSLDASKVINVSAAISEKFAEHRNDRSEKKNTLLKFGLTRNFILYVGGGDARKNIATLISAYASLSENLRNQYDLVLVGPNIHRTDIHSLSYPELAKRVHILGHLSDEELTQFYQSCSLFVFPSLYEGFGLPPLEAMSCGAPVISSNSTSLPEVIGFEEALFNASSVQEIREAISRGLCDENFRAILVKHGLNQAKLFAWSTTAKKALMAIENSLQPVTKKNGTFTIQRDHSARILYQSLVTKIASLLSSTGKPSENEIIRCAKAISDTFPIKPTLPRLFVDISELAQRDSKTGIQRVTRSILHELLVNPPPGYMVEPVYGTIEKIGYRFAKKFTSQFLGSAAVSEKDEFINPQIGDLFLGLDLQHHTTRVQRDYLQYLRQIGIPIFFVVYDLLPIQFPHFWPLEHQVDKVHEEWLRVVCDGDGAICISNAVANQLDEWIKATLLPKTDFQISWFHLGADLQGSLPTVGIPSDASSILTNLGKRPSFLLVGTIEPRKGYNQVLKAFEILWEHGLDINLIIVGKKGWGVDELINKLNTHPENKHRLFWLEGISDEYLEKIYATSTCLIAASHGEGFGLPLIEAAQHQIPIIARDIPVFKEVAGEGAFYFKATCGEDLAIKIKEWLNLYTDKKIPKSSTITWHTWKESAKDLSSKLLQLV